MPFVTHMRRPSSVLAAFCLGVLLPACRSAPAPSIRGDSVAEAIRTSYAAELEGVIAAVDRLEATLTQDAAPPGADESVQRAFAEARDRYKRVEFLVEYYSPAAADEINGPALPEVDEDDPNRFEHPPEGFQVVEEYLYPEVQWEARREIVNEVGILRNHLRRVAQLTRASVFADAQVWDAARLEIVRVATLGISGFDSPVALRSLPEGVAALQGTRTALELYRPRLDAGAPAAGARLAERLDAAIAFLGAGGDFDGFDRLTFLREHVPAALAALADARTALGIDLPAEPRALRGEATHLFAADAFDPHFFAPPGSPRPTPAQVELGRQIFFDPVLSGGGERTCASCHLPERAFTDGLPRSRPLSGARNAVLRNAPTLINSALQAGSFYDVRTRYLEDQVSDVVRNRDEMHGDLDTAAERLRRDPAYAPLLREALAPGTPRLGGEEVRAAVAAYIRSLNGTSSRFDRYMRGEEVALADAEKRGFNLFMGRAKCGTCHFAPLFNGTVPPLYQKAEVEVLGVPRTADARRARVDSDPGRYPLYRVEHHRHAFKTPTVRNAELTAPYMHNGVYRTLEEVVDFYDAGGGAGLGITLANQTLPPDSLRLSGEEKQDLVAFMRALTDTTGLSSRPAPRSGAVVGSPPPRPRPRS